jgi:hypothetical protein
MNQADISVGPNDPNIHTWVKKKISTSHTTACFNKSGEKISNRSEPT